MGYEYFLKATYVLGHSVDTKGRCLNQSDVSKVFPNPHYMDYSEKVARIISCGGNQFNPP